MTVAIVAMGQEFSQIDLAMRLAKARVGEDEARREIMDAFVALRRSGNRPAGSNPQKDGERGSDAATVALGAQYDRHVDVYEKFGRSKEEVLRDFAGGEGPVNVKEAIARRKADREAVSN